MNNPPGNDPNVYNSPPPPPPAYGSMPPPQSYTSVPPPPRQNSRVWMYVAIGLVVACVLCVGVAGIVALVGGNLFRSVAATVQPQLTQMAPTMQAIATQVQQQPAPQVDNFSPFVKNITLSEGVQGDNLDPVNPTNVFKPNGTIHAVVQVADVPDGTKFKMVWYAENVGDAAAANTKIAEYELPASGTRNLDFTLAPNNQWPEGLYRGELFVNGAADRVVRFNVKQ